MTEPNDIVGHKTFRDGASFRHEPLRRDEADAIMAAIYERDRKRAELMPDERAAINMFFEAFQRLKELGWREAVYCPKDGTSFEVIEAGSTGIHDCFYEGKWPNGTWWVGDGMDICSSRPVLFRPKQEAAAPPCRAETPGAAEKETRHE